MKTCSLSIKGCSLLCNSLRNARRTVAAVCDRRFFCGNSEAGAHRAPLQRNLDRPLAVQTFSNTLFIRLILSQTHLAVPLEEAAAVHPQGDSSPLL